MKKSLIIICILVFFVAICFGIEGIYTYNVDGEKVNPGEVQTTRNTWAVVDSTTSDGDEPNDLAVDERTYATVNAAAEGGDSEITTYSIPRSFNAARFRCIGITNDQSVTYQIYLGTLGIGGTDCEYAKAGQLAFTIGTQASETADYEFADAVTVTEYCWVKSWSSKSPGNNLVAETAVDLMGADILVAVPTTAGCDCKLLIKGF